MTPKQPHRRSGRVLWLLTAILAAAGLYFFPPKAALRRAKWVIFSRPASATAPAGVPKALAGAVGTVLSPNGEEPSHVADDLNSPSADVHQDLRTVSDLFDMYRSAVHGPNPVGENNEIVAVLTGKNKLGYSFLPKNSPAINADGQLVDRWGTPYFFHSLSGEQMEIRSAGPDHKLWTADDEVLTPGLYKPPL